MANPGKRPSGGPNPVAHSDVAHFRLNNWLPYSFSFIASRISNTLAEFYKTQFGLSVPAWRIMVRLGSDGVLTAKQVGQLSTIDPVQVTRSVNELAKLGFISRRVDPADRRRVVLKLSAKGKAAYDAIIPIACKLEDWLLAELTEDEQQLLHSLLQRLFERMNTKASELQNQP